jgi:predicted metalloprotease with PDZ domain
MSLVELSRIGSLMYSEDFRTGRTLFSKGALMADEMDRLIRKETSGKKGLRDSLRAMVAWGLKNKRPFTLEEFPGLIAKPVGVDEKDISAIVQRWLDRQEN